MRAAATLLALSSALSACFERDDRESGVDPGTDADTDADSDSDSDTDSDTDADLDTADTAAPTAPRNGEMAFFAFDLFYGVSAAGLVVPVTFPGYGAVEPYLQLTEYDAVYTALCSTTFVVEPTASDWAPADYFSWKIAVGDLTVETDECAGYTATATSDGGTLADLVASTSFKISIAELGPQYATGADPYAAGGQFNWEVASSSEFATFAYEVDAAMNIESDDGVTLNPIPAADIPSAGGVISAFYTQSGLTPYYFQ
jgi:hypothetical protein